MDLPPIDTIVTELLAHCSGGTVLDLGAGEGRHALALARQGFTVTAVEIDDWSLAELRKRTEAERLVIEAVQADMMTYQPAHRFDVVIATAAMTQLDAGRIELLVRRMQEWTARHGWNVVFAEAPHMEDEHRPGYTRRLPWCEWYRDWELVSYTEETEAFESKVPWSDKWLKNTMVRLLARKPKA